jgi:penicillin-binding protein 1B
VSPPNAVVIRLKLAKRYSPAVRTAAAAAVLAVTLLLGTFIHYYVQFERLVERRMRGQVFNNASKIYAQPRVLRPGLALTVKELAEHLRNAGYADLEQAPRLARQGVFRLSADSVEIRPGPDSYHDPEPVLVRIRGGKVERIERLAARTQGVAAYELEPQLVTALFDAEQRSKRRLVAYHDIPKVMVDAVIAIEDRRFFRHSGVNYWRFGRATWDYYVHGPGRPGGSTITMQLARGFFLSPEKTPKRKATEIMIAFQLENRFSKEEIFELYANQVPMGQRGSFAIQGLAEGARSFFNRDLKNVTLPEAALLAGLIQRPSYLNPYRHPQRALDRRNLVLEAMVETGAITREEAETAKAAPLNLAPPNIEASDAPYFVDLVRESLLERYSEQELNEGALRIYTTIDPDLQQAAADAVEEGMKLVDEQIARLRTRRVRVGTGKDAKWENQMQPGPTPQVALVVLDPHTGEVLALVGGRNYGRSQLNRAVARRPVGSVFKPFVFAAAMNTAVEGGELLFTPASLLEDEPTSFLHGQEVYEPRNYKNEYHGTVTARVALARSLNNATVRLAEYVGYDHVTQLARAAGLTSVMPTPAMALGAYDATPLQVASAYTIFANDGVRLEPRLIKSIRRPDGSILAEFRSQARPVLDPRVAYIVTNMMEGVVNSGTGAVVRSRGFRAPAAGKTGTSHDAWFAGYTSNLLCIVWVGFDDYLDLRLSGSSTAAPIWAEFMKKAIELPRYSDVKPFPQPPGVVQVSLDRESNQLATPSCPQTYPAAFIAGTEPTETCESYGLGQRGIFGHVLNLAPKPLPPGAVSTGGATTLYESQGGPVTERPAPAQKRRGFFGRILGVFRDDEPEPAPQAAPPAERPRPQPPSPAPPQ